MTYADDEWTVFKVATGECVGVWPKDRQPVLCSLDGRIVVTSDSLCIDISPIRQWLRTYLPAMLNRAWEPVAILRLWDVETLREIAVLPGQWPSDFSPDGRTLATYDYWSESVINLWDLPPRKPRLRPLAWSLLVALLVVLAGCWWFESPGRPTRRA